MRLFVFSLVIIFCVSVRPFHWSVSATNPLRMTRRQGQVGLGPGSWGPSRACRTRARDDTQSSTNLSPPPATAPTRPQPAPGGDRDWDHSDWFIPKYFRIKPKSGSEENLLAAKATNIRQSFLKTSQAAYPPSSSYSPSSVLSTSSSLRLSTQNNSPQSKVSSNI